EAGEAARAAEVERTRVDYLDRQSLESDRRREALSAERAGLDLDALAEAFAGVAEEHEAQKIALEDLNEALEARRQAALELQDQQRAAQQEISEVRKQAQEARGRLSSLETLQHAALGQEQGAAMAWLRARGLDSARRVGEALEVEPGWENAVEGALGQMIEGVLVDAPEALVEALADLGDGRIALVAADDGEAAFAPTSLAARVRGPLAIRRLLAPLHVAGSPAEARALQATLDPADSVITRDGERLGAGWLRVLRSGAARQGALLREREIQGLRERIEDLQAREAGLEDALAKGRERLLAAEQAREDAQRQLYHAHRNISELAGRLQGQQGRLDAARTRIERIDAELAQLGESIAGSGEQAREARGRLEDAVARMADLEEARRALEAERARHAAARDEARAAARESREHTHALALQLETQRTQASGLRQALQRMGGQRGQLDTRLGELASQLAAGDSPGDELERQRQAALAERVRADPVLAEARRALDGIDANLREHEQVRHQREEQAIAQREAIAQRRLDQQALAIHAEQLAAAVAEAGFVLEEVVAGLPEDADAAAWGRMVADFDARLRRLEPVNLAAIQEHAEAAQRKEYLDSQDADLRAALETLEEAIRKIDRETRGRFKDTFDRVNAGVQEIYPRLFGGGHAYLELTGEDLLDTGVAIMARPPGKRVSNISLLSGGEKAMTAVALVFAIFQLNPAPFCLLDEVDAPLDEANVGRFSAMVTEMSEK